MTASLTVLFDLKDPYSYLAMAPTLTLIRETGVESSWHPFIGKSMRPAEVPGDDADVDRPDRGTLHRFRRAAYYQADLCRYAAARELPARHFMGDALYRQADGTVAALGFNWAGARSTDRALEFLAAGFEGFWDGDLDIDSVDQVEAALRAAGVDTTGFAAFCAGPGLQELAEQRAELVDAGAFTAPACLLDGEAYVGRQHLGLIRWKLMTENR